MSHTRSSSALSVKTASGCAHVGSVAAEAIPTADIRDQLARIVTSRSFARSDRLQQMLIFMVDTCLAGDGAQLSAYTLATHVFDRPESFQSQTDSLVRVHSGRLRRQLAQYYELEGWQDPIEIRLRPGGYCPDFAYRPAQAPAQFRVETRMPEPFAGLGPPRTLQVIQREIRMVDVPDADRLRALLSLSLVCRLANTPGIALRLATQSDNGGDYAFELHLHAEQTQLVLTLILTRPTDGLVIAAVQRPIQPDQLAVAENRDQIATWVATSIRNEEDERQRTMQSGQEEQPGRLANS